MDRQNKYGGQDRASALRNSRSPPRTDFLPSGARSGSQGKPISPLRSRVATGQNSAAQPNHMADQREEEQYERHRQGELRRQIVEKERELDTVSSKHRDRMNKHHHALGDTQFGTTAGHQQQAYPHRSSSSGMQHTQAQPRGKGSPLRSRDGSAGVGYQSSYAVRSGSSNGFQRNDETLQRESRGPPQHLQPQSRPPMIPPTVNNYMMRQKSPSSPLRQKSGSPTRDIDTRDAGYGLLTGPQQRVTISPVRTASNEYLSQLQQDNGSLQKRLNLVLQELDRVNRDRSKLVHKMSLVDQDVQIMQSKLHNEDNADQMNNEMQLDVNGQRDNNVNIKRTIHDTDFTRNDAIQKLRQLQAERDRKTHMSNELSDDLQKKLQVTKQLEEDQYHAHEKISELERQISDLNRTALQDDSQIDDIKHINDKLTAERDDLHDKLTQLNGTYDNCVNEISRERAQMQGHNRHHNKLLVAKVTFSLLEHMFQKRKQEAMNEFFQYCKFDSKCHNTLKQFVKTMERLGKFRQRIAIKQWHQRTFKPIEMKVQEQDLCHEFMRRKLLSKMFNMWRNRQQNAENLYGAKNRALQAIWNAKAKDCGKDVQRAFQMWRDNMNYAKFRNQRCKKMIWKQYSNMLAKAFQKWNDYSANLNGQVRLHCLAKTFAENQHKRICFASMRFELFDMRRKRLNRLRMFLKAWKESKEYNKFILQSNMMVLGFKKQSNESLMQMCFNALRNSKEEEKLMLMTEALEGDCLPAMESLNKSIEVKTQEAVRSGRNRGLDAIKKRIYAQVGEYFYKWKNVGQHHNIVLSKNIKGMIIRRFQQSLRDAMDLWKKGGAHQEITMQGGMIMEMQEEGSGLAAAVDDLSKKIEIKKKEVDRSGRSALNRGTKIMTKRYYKQYFDKWAETNKKVNKQTEGGDLICKKMRLRFLREGFRLYKAGCARDQLEQRNEGSCDQLKAKLDCMLMRKCFNGMRKFNQKNSTAKRYTNIMLSKMDRWMKKRAFRTWNDGGNIMKMEMHMEHQNALTEETTVLNHDLGVLTKKHADKCARNDAATLQLKKMGQRTISNAFARCYKGSTQKAFDNWKEWNRADKHKQAILRRTMDHWLKKAGKYLLAVMLDWKMKSKIGDGKAAIGQMEYEMNDMGIVQNHDTVVYQKKKADLLEATRCVNTEYDKTLAKRSKMMSLMTDNNENMHFQGKLRAVFLEWAAHTKRMVHMNHTLKTVIQKSMWQRGFQNIREYARDKNLTRGQNTAANKLRMRWWKRNCGAAFSKWRQTEYEQTCEMIMETQEMQGNMTTEHMQKKKIIQKQNMVRSSKILNKQEKHKYYQAWKNVTRWLKHKRVSTANLLEAQSSYAVKRLIKKWRARTETTICGRAAYNKFQEKRDLMYKKSCFREFMLKHHRDKALILRLSNAARKFDNRHLQSAFQMIRNYWITKNNVQAAEKGISSRNLADTLKKIYRRKLLQYYSHMRRQIHGDKVTAQKKKILFGHFITQNVRDAFSRWKRQAEFETTVIDVNECGPVVEEVLEHRLDCHNLKNLMADEGFTEHQITDVENNADKKSLELMNKSIGRWKHWNGTDDYLKPKMFDRWIRFVKFRKIVRHWLEFITNRQQHQKADLGYCFNKWKFHFSDQQNILQKRTRAQLMARAVKAAKRLEVLADSTQQDEDMITHISDQNEELFNNYRKGQKLALALGRDNHRQSMMKGFKRMMQSAADDKKRHLEGILQRNIDMIASTKDKIKEVENDNECLANENEELRQFSLDGYQLGKNVQTLTGEREKLSVDLADKANTIKKLLDENERLSMRLRQAQDSAAHLLQQSQVRAH